MRKRKMPLAGTIGLDLRSTSYRKEKRGDGKKMKGVFFLSMDDNRKKKNTSCFKKFFDKRRKNRLKLQKKNPKETSLLDEVRLEVTITSNLFGLRTSNISQGNSKREKKSFVFTANFVNEI